MTVPELHDETAFAAAGRAPPRASCRCTATGCSARYEEAEDLTQETFLRAWRRRETYARRASLRAWLYRIATNACLDALEKRPADARAERRDHVAAAVSRRAARARAARRADVVVARETIELAFMVAIQHLAAAAARGADPARRARLARAGLRRAARDHRGGRQQRAAAGARRAEGAPAEASAASGRRTAARRSARCSTRYMAACEAGDAHGIEALMHEDARFSMPPEPEAVRRPRDDRQRLGRGRLRHARRSATSGASSTRANRQPAVANYLRSPARDEYTLAAVDVLRIEGGLITDVTAFSRARR